MIFVNFYKNVKLNEKGKTFFYCRIMNPSDLENIKSLKHHSLCSPVGIATAYGLDGPVIESQWGRDFPHLSRPGLRPTQPPVQWVPGLSRG